MRAFLSIAICLVSLLLFNGSGEALPCGKYIGELYQIEIDYENSRSYALFTLGAENQVTMIDSTEGGTFSNAQAIDAGFTSQLGRWQCVSEHDIRIDSFNYVHPISDLNGRGTLSWSVWSLKFSEQTHSFTGTLNYEYYPVGSNLLVNDRCSIAESTNGPFPIHAVRFPSFEQLNSMKNCQRVDPLGIQ